MSAATTAQLYKAAPPVQYGGARSKPFAQSKANDTKQEQSNEKQD